MPYTIKKSDGVTLTTVPDGAVDSTTTPLNLVGKNTAGYGAFQNENFLYLLENFADTQPPSSPMVGMLWYDTTNKILKHYDGIKWQSMGTVNVYTNLTSATANGSFIAGSIVYVTDTKQIFVYDGANFVLVGPEVAEGFGITKHVSMVLTGTDENNYPVIVAKVDDKNAYLISTNVFTLKTPAVLSSDFTNVSKGINLPKTSVVGVSSSDYIVNGTAVNALNLGAKLASSYVINDSDSQQNIANSVGIESNLSLGLVGGNYTSTLTVEDTSLVVRNNLDNKIIFEVKDNSGTSQKVVMVDGSPDETGDATRISFAPVSTLPVDVGTPNRPFRNVFADMVNANLTGNVTSSTVQASQSVVSNIVKAREILRFTDNTLAIKLDYDQNNDSRTRFYGVLEGDVNANLVDTTTLTADNATIGTLNLSNIAVTGGTLDNVSITNSTISTSSWSGGSITSATLLNASLTGTPTAPTLTVANNSNQVATTGFVHSILPRGMIMMWSGSHATIPSGWALCNGQNQTPDLRGRFIIGADVSGNYQPGNSGGAETQDIFTQAAGAHNHGGTGAHALTINEIPSHTHDYDDLYSLQDDQGPAVIDRYGNRIEKFDWWGSDGDADSGNGAWFYSRTAAAGGSQGHAHPINQEGNHTHAIDPVDVRPPYYALCFIMKIY